MDTCQTRLNARRHGLLIRNAASGIAIVTTLVGLTPMALALGVSNRLIDDGADPGDAAIMAAWNGWAFSPIFFSFTMVGFASLVAIGFSLDANERKPFVVNVCWILGGAIFAALFFFGRFWFDVQ